MEKKLSEDSILEIIHAHFMNESDELIVGRGDDCALLNLDTQNNTIAVITDIFLENAHFKRDYFSPEAIGYKSLAVNISDIYSMGGQPKSAQLALTLPSSIDFDFLERSLSSMAKLMKEHGIFLSGGDLTKSDAISFTISLMGLVDKEVQLLRDKGEIDDIVFLIGEVGLSRLALTLLEEKSKNIDNYPKAMQAHFFPKMHRESALALAEFAKNHKDSAFSLMDVSDGLARDLPRLVQKYGVDITMSQDMIDEEIMRFCKNDEEKAIEFAILGGEDYALLGTCPRPLFSELLSICPHAKNIGTIKADKNLSYRGKNLALCGYDHFTK